MKKVLLATVAAAVISFPAAAGQYQQQTGASERSPAGAQPMQGEAQRTESPAVTQPQELGERPGAAGVQQTAEVVSPSELNEDQIRELQQTLNERGFHAGNVDGIWGPKTQAAIRNFQETENMQATGQITHETLSALDLQFAGVMDEPTTTGAGVGPGGEPTTTGSGATERAPDAGAAETGTTGSGGTLDAEGQGAADPTESGQPDGTDQSR
jgi:hypothetical protein